MPLFKINWEDEVKAGSDGYSYVTTTPPHPHGEKRGDRNKQYIYLHRALMELKLNRYLKPEEEVDHIDMNNRNNDPSNLRLHEHHGDHSKQHSTSKPDGSPPDNPFWRKSPRNKPGRKAAQRVVASFLTADGA